MRMTEKEAIDHGLIQPPVHDPVEERAKQLAIDTVNKYRTRPSGGWGFIACLALIMGWMIGFICALAINPQCARVMF